MTIKEKVKKTLSSNKILVKPYNALLTKKRRIVYRKKYLHNFVDDKLVVFEAFMGRKYACSPKAIYEYMIHDERFKDYTFVWAFKNPKEKKKYFDDKRTILVTYNRAKYYEYCSKAKYWITNSRIPDVLIKKDEQIYIQCWHGTPLKRLGYDIKVKGGNITTSNKKVRKQYRNDARNYTYLLSPSEYCSSTFISAFNLKKLKKETAILQQGYPRNDYLFTYQKSDIVKIKNELKIGSNKKVILYAPTWRENQHDMKKGYIYDVAIDFDNLKRQIGNDYVILFRPHYFVANRFDFSKYEGFIYNVANYEDINELYIISDILITDYSSVLFDYANLKRPMLFYMYDLDEYKNKLRDFYIDLNVLPGPIVETEKELIEELKKIDQYDKTYSKKYKKFNETFNYLDDGNAAKRVVEVIFDGENQKTISKIKKSK